MDLTNYQGHVKKGATVISNDPRNQQVSLYLQGIVRPLIEVRPNNRVQFTGLSGRIEDHVVELVSHSQPFKILKVDTNLEGRVGHSVTTVAEGTHYRIQLSNLAKLGTYNGYVRIRTSLPQKQEINLWVSGHIEGEISVKPQTLLVGRLANQREVRSGKILVVSNRNEPFKITRMDYDKNLIQVEEKPLPEGSGTGFSLEVSPRVENIAVNKQMQTVLSIETESSSRQKHEVRIHLLNTPPAGGSVAQ